MARRRGRGKRRELKTDKIQSIMMMPRDWLKRLDTWEEFKEELKR